MTQSLRSHSESNNSMPLKTSASSSANLQMALLREKIYIDNFGTNDPYIYKNKSYGLRFAVDFTQKLFTAKQFGMDLHDLSFVVQAQQKEIWIYCCHPKHIQNEQNELIKFTHTEFQTWFAKQCDASLCELCTGSQFPQMMSFLQLHQFTYAV